MIDSPGAPAWPTVPSCFGREALLGDMSAWLAHASGMVWWLHGIGGIGKTQVARKLASLATDSGHLVVWIDVDVETAWARCQGTDRPLARDRTAFERGQPDVRAEVLVRGALGASSGVSSTFYL